MKKSVVILFLGLIFLPVVLASSVDVEMQKITHSAEEFEIGNIDYVQLLVYLSSAREGLNEILGATGREMGGVVKQEEIEKILGESNEQTKWVWVEGEEQEKKLDYYVPQWKKIVFDGKKLQIRLSAFPSLFKEEVIYRLHFDIEFKKPSEQLDIQGKIKEIKSFAEIFSADSSQSNAENLAKKSVIAEMIFRNYFEQGSGKCEDLMKSIFGSENQRQTQQILLNEINFFEGEKFEAIIRLEMCDDCEWNYINLDMRLEGRGNFKQFKEEGDMGASRERFDDWDDEGFKRETRKILEEIRRDLEQGNYGVANADSQKLRMVTEAWNKKANDVWDQIEKKDEVRTIKKTENNVLKEDNIDNVVVENTEGLDVEVVDNVVVDNVVVDNVVVDNVVVDNVVVDNVVVGNSVLTGNVITGYVIEENNKQSEEEKDPYFWIKKDQAQRQKMNELKKFNYESRKLFYLDLFSGYDKREFYFSQTDFEKRLIEEFRERGEEICDNNQDDNDNEQVDCDDAQCGGKICGRESVSDGNGTKDVELYCIFGSCQAKEQEESDEPVCGNNFCEVGEGVCLSSLIICDEGDGECSATSDCGSVYCPEDCVRCAEHEPIKCSGRVEFEGEDEKGCPLPPVCIEEEVRCDKDEDCEQPKCGVVGCVKDNSDEKGICEMITLTKCEESICEAGEKQIKECEDEELVSAVCVNGNWEYMDVECLMDEGEDCNQHCNDYMSTLMPSCPGNLKISGTYPDCSCNWVCEELVNDECVMASDCGGENDVCSNGKCETIPEKISVEPEYEVEVEVEEEVEEREVELEVEEEEVEGPGVTGNVIFNFIRGFFSRGITGYVVDEGGNGDVESNPEPEFNPEPEYSPPESDSEPEQLDESLEYEQPNEPPQEPDNDCRDKWKACGDPCPPCDYDKGIGDEGSGEGEWEDRKWEDEGRGEWEDKDNEERERHEKEQGERCNVECSRSCIEKCIRDSCGESMDCDIDKESKSCEAGCSPEGDCIEKCMSGDENWWQEFQDEDMHKEEKGVFMVGGGCRKEKGRTDGYIWFGGWGEPFERIERLKHKYYERGDDDWCKHEVENLIKQRKEFEKGFNQEFAVWFFEKYIPNSAEEWEQAQSSIFELYWNSVDSQMRLAHTMQCLEKRDISEIMDVNLINVEYETEFGKLEYWEELNEVKVPGLEEKVTIVSPYMRVWIFPSEEFIKYDMKESMEEHELFGSPEEKMERKNQGGLTEEQKAEIRNDDKAMKRIIETAERYGGSFDFVIQFKDYEADEVVFNMYVNINEQDIMKVEPMLPSEVGEVDATVVMDFALLYEMIFVSEKDMMGDHIESPPWDRKMKPVQKFKEIGNGVKMWNKLRVLKNSVVISPNKDKRMVEKMTEWVMEVVMRGSDKGERDEGFEEDKESEEGEGMERGEKPEFGGSGISGKVVWVE